MIGFNSWRIMGLILAGVMAIGSAAAQGQEPTEVLPPISPAEVAQVESIRSEIPKLNPDAGVKLTLREVVNLTLANNPNIQITGLDVEISVDDIEAAKGIYDPVLRALASHSNVEEPQAIKPGAAGVSGSEFSSFFSVDEANVTEVTTGEASVSQLLPTGATVQLSLVQQRVDLEDSRGESSTRINPAYFSEAVLSLRQPLLKNFGWKVTNSGIKIAKINNEISDQDLREETIIQIAQVARTYWDLAFALQSYEAQLVSLQLADDLYRVNLARYRAGVRPITDVLQAQAEVTSRESAVVTSFQAIENLQDSLIRLIHSGHGDATSWNRPIFPADAPTSTPIALDDTYFITEAMAKRPEIIKAESGIDIAEIQQMVARNQRLPSLDAFGSWGFMGDDGHADDSWDDVEDTRFDQWAIGLEFEYAIPNRRARAQYRQSVARLDQAELVRDALEQTIIQQVRFSSRGVRTAGVQIGVNESRLKFEGEKLRSQEKRYEVGLATAFELLDFQEDYTDAQVSLYKSLSDFEKSKVDLAVSTGKLLEFVGIEVGP